MSLALLLTLSAQTALHDAIAVAAGEPGFLVLWEQQAKVGAQREVMATPTGSNTRAVKVLDAGGEASELSAVWNGRAWTIAVCNPAWGTNNDHAMLVWGELGTDGTFIRRGEHDFGAAGALHCSQLRVDDGVPNLYASVREDEHCASRRFELVGRVPVIGPPRPVCRVWAEAGGFVFGPDASGKGTMVDPHGETARAAVTAESDVRGATVVTRSQATIRFWDAPFHKPARVLTPRTSIDPYAAAAVVAMPDGGVALVQAHDTSESDLEAVWLDRHGKRVASEGFGTKPAALLACAAGDGALYCAYAGDGLGQVYSERIAPP
jgi:hypothetical protein